MVSFVVDWEGFSLRLRVEAVPRVPRARRLRMEAGSGTVEASNACRESNVTVPLNRDVVSQPLPLFIYERGMLLNRNPGKATDVPFMILN